MLSALDCIQYSARKSTTLPLSVGFSTRPQKQPYMLTVSKMAALASPLLFHHHSSRRPNAKPSQYRERQPAHLHSTYKHYWQVKPISRTTFCLGALVTGYSTDVIQALYINNDINQTMTSLATTMGNHIRLKGAFRCIRHDTSMVTFIHFRWLWLILPFFLEALTSVTRIATIILSAVRAVPKWKSSALAPMFHGVHIDITKFACVENNEGMETFTEHSQAVLIMENGRAALRSIPNLHGAEPLLLMKDVVSRQDGSLS